MKQDQLICIVFCVDTHTQKSKNHARMAITRNTGIYAALLSSK